jgi:26S proteasome regulatory subunit T5
MKSELTHLSHEQSAMQEQIKDNKEKIKMNKVLPYLVANVVELLACPPEDDASKEDIEKHTEDSKKLKNKGDNQEAKAGETKDGKSGSHIKSGHSICAVIKTTTRQTIFLPMIGLVSSEKLKPNDLVGVNKDSYLILDTLPPEYDARVKAMEVDERPSEDYNEIGGLDKQIEELVEAVVLPMQHPDRFMALGIKPPKGH